MCAGLAQLGFVLSYHGTRKMQERHLKRQNGAGSQHPQVTTSTAASARDGKSALALVNKTPGLAFSYSRVNWSLPDKEKKITSLVPRQKEESR